MIPERSNVSKSAKSVFFEDVNDIDIYIEDTELGYTKLFSIIFTRILKDKYRVEKVFPIGDRKSVIEQHGKHVSRGRPSIYIIDGDLFIMAGDEVESKPGLYVLPMYCIENILCDHEAIVDILDEEDPVQTREEIFKKFDYDGWVIENCDLLFQLFIEYSISFKVNPSEQTVSYPVKNIVASEKGNISSDKVLSRIKDLRIKSIKNAGEEEYESIRNKMISQFGEEARLRLIIVSGKNYIFPLLKMRAKSIVKTKIPDINLKQRIAKRCSLAAR